mgnify:CR=1 FL=1
MQVVELAKDLKVSPEVVLTLLRELGIPVGGADAAVAEADVARVLARVERERRSGKKSLSEAVEAAVEEGRFRTDLFFRLKVVPIEVPPLRERRYDIPVLLRHCLDRQDEGRFVEVTPEAEAASEGRLVAGSPAMAMELAEGLEELDGRGLDLILLVRGGGAYEDLAAFYRAQMEPSRAR